MADDRSGADQLLGGRYRLIERLGNGAVASVYRAVDVVLGRPVAVKVYRPASDTTSLYRFGAEARLHAGLSHPNLVAVHDVCLNDEQPYLVVQLVRGEALSDRIARGPLDPTVTARFGALLADALAYVHGQGIVHRDLKPSNVLLDEADGCYLADFGMARALGAVHLTATGDVVGTAAYLAPEQVSDAEPGPPTDVYALGLVLLECLTGEPAYTGTTVEVALARLARQPRIPDTLPSGWRSVLTAMTAREPDKRPDAARCARLLLALADGDHAAVDLPRAKSGRAHAGAAAAVALAAAVGALAFATLPTVPGQPTGEPPAEGTSSSGAPVPTSPGDTENAVSPTDRGSADQPRSTDATQPPTATPVGSTPTTGTNQTGGTTDDGTVDEQPTPVTSADQTETDKPKPGGGTRPPGPPSDPGGTHRPGS